MESRSVQRRKAIQQDLPMPTFSGSSLTPDIKTLILLRGLPGSGKTTCAELLKSLSPSTVNHVEADQFFSQSGTYVFDPMKLAEAHKWCQKQVEQWMTDGAPVIIVSNTFTRNWEMNPYRTLGKKFLYRTIVLTIDSGLSYDALARRNVHGVPTETIHSMEERWENLSI